MEKKTEGLLGYTGQPASVTLKDGLELSAGEVVGQGFALYINQEESGDVAGDDWNALPDADRKRHCLNAISALDNSQLANSMTADKANLAAAIGNTAHELLGAALIDAALTECKALAKPWAMLSEDAQSEVLGRITDQVKAAVADTIRLLSTGGQPSIVCDLESITVKKGAKATLSIPKGAGLDQDLLDAVGQPVLLVIGGHLGGEKEIQAPRPDPTQRSLLGPDSGVVHSSPED